MKQRLYLSTIIANEAVLSRERIEALAFSMQIKLTFVSSVVQSATILRCKSIFGMGSTKMSRIIRNSLKYGYIKRVGNDLIALPFKGTKNYCLKLDFAYLTASLTGKNVCQYSIKDIVRLIKQSVLLNHIRKTNNCADTFNTSSDPKSNSALKKAKSKLKRMQCDKFYGEGLSIKRIMAITNTKRTNARKLIGGLVMKGLVDKVDQSVRTNIDPLDFVKSSNTWFKESGCRGYLYRKGCAIYCRLSNIYKYNSDVITYIK